MFVIFITILSCLSNTDALDNGLAITPPMGWSSWLRFGCDVNEQIIKTMADLIVRNGYKGVGYEHVIIDDGWQERVRDVSGRLQANRRKFPNGIKSVADYVHALGLKLGIFSDLGTSSGCGSPGSANHFQIDANTFAEWEIDYVKMSGASANPRLMNTEYPEFGNYLKATGRNMVYATSWAAYQEYDYNHSPQLVDYHRIARECNTWRYCGDMQDNWSTVLDILDCTSSKQTTLLRVAGPGSWNDPDVLTIGNGGLNEEQSQTQMVMWAILAAPLIMSNDLTYVTPEMSAILQNREIIKINQDPWHIQGFKLFKDNNIEAWMRPISPMDGSEYTYAIALFYRHPNGVSISYSIRLIDMGFRNPDGYYVTDVLRNANGYNMQKTLPTNRIQMEIKPGGVALFTVRNSINEPSYARHLWRPL